MFCPGSKPRGGNSSPKGGVSLNFEPSAAVSESVRGLNLRSPAREIAVTISGEVTKACVAGFASLRPVKFLLYDVMIEFLVPLGTSSRFHCPTKINN